MKDDGINRYWGNWNAADGNWGGTEVTIHNDHGELFRIKKDHGRNSVYDLARRLMVYHRILGAIDVADLEELAEDGEHMFNKLSQLIQENEKLRAFHSELCKLNREQK